MIDTFVEWFKASQYKDENKVTVANIVKNMWMTRYP